MKKLILALFVLTPIIILTGCSVTTARYAPGYAPSSYNAPKYNDFVYSVSYYGYRPYWGTPFRGGIGWKNGYWGGYSGSYIGGYPQAWYSYVSRW